MRSDLRYHFSQLPNVRKPVADVDTAVAGTSDSAARGPTYSLHGVDAPRYGLYSHGGPWERERVGAPRGEPWGRSRLLYARRRKSVRTGFACAINRSMPSVRKPWPADIPGNLPRPWAVSARGVQPLPRQKGAANDVGHATHTKTDVVVTVVRMVVVAVGRARVVLIVDPGPAAPRTPEGLREPRRISPACIV